MKTKIEIKRGSYGFGHTWTLVVEYKDTTRAFYLGQDVKFCSRVLGLSPRDVVHAIGTGEISEGEVGNGKLARFIVKELGLTKKKVMALQPWELCAE
jgi:hypothetical protein